MAGDPVDKPNGRLDTLGKKGFLLHADDRPTYEGFGYLSGWTIFPFVELALAADLVPVFNNDNVAQGNRQRNYTKLDVASFLDFDQRYSISEIKENSTVVTLNTWEMDRPNNDALTHIVKETVERNFNEGKVLTISLVGPLQQQQHPVPRVVEWFREKSSNWKQQNAPLKIVMHIRRGDTADRATGEASERWAHKYGLPIYEEILNAIQDAVPEILRCRIDVFTESNFSYSEQNALKEQWPSLEFHRGDENNPLPDLREMGTADIFLPSASYFSGFAGYFIQPDSVIVLGRPPCYLSYFSIHRECAYQVFTVGDATLVHALRNVVVRKRGEASFKAGDRVHTQGLTSDAG